MKRIKNSAEVPQTGQPIILAMGCFDGVHIGHQKVMTTAVEQATSLGGEAWVFTFRPHPAKVLCPDKAPPLISAEPCRLRQIEALGIRGIIEIPFTPEFARLPPDLFLTDLCETLPTLAGITCGQDWSFGYKAQGHLKLLEQFGIAHGFTVTAVPHVLCDGEKVSSTHIRQAISQGDIPVAETLLGRPFSLFGTVIHGEKIGRQLGFPTANVDPENELIPADGVYAAWTRIKSQTSKVEGPSKTQRTEDRGQKTENQEPQTSNPKPPSSTLFPSAVFIGARETFNLAPRVIESHLLDFDQDLYGQAIEVSLVERIRDVTPFSSKEALIEQIEKDISQIKMRLKTSH